jgi:two-component system response regulator HupR/HoxA
MDLPTESVLFGGTAGMRRVQEEVERVLSCDLPVLIRGESGTGKKMMAQYIHYRSNRSSLPFLKLNCAALSAEQTEAALFGSAESAGSELKSIEINKLSEASGSTLLLEEAGAIDLGLQRKIRLWLRELNSNCVKGDVVRVSQMRVICTAQPAIEGLGSGERAFDQLLDKGGFLSLSLLALRDRRQDIPEICDFLLYKLARRYGKRRERIDLDTLQQLMNWDWPGNLTELESWIARFLILGIQDAPGWEMKKSQQKARLKENPPILQPPLGESAHPVEEMSPELMVEVLQANGWSRRRAAEQLQISYGALLRKLHNAEIPYRRRGHKGGRLDGQPL